MRGVAAIETLRLIRRPWTDVDAPAVSIHGATSIAPGLVALMEQVLDLDRTCFIVQRSTGAAWTKAFTS